jgi:hypothetical protein
MYISLGLLIVLVIFASGGFSHRTLNEWNKCLMPEPLVDEKIERMKRIFGITFLIIILGYLTYIMF